jgi:oxaloacetate decarboxylase (Na+ extruding) subunit gamma
VQARVFEQGLELMLYGMGTVVVFLALLVLATSAMSRLINRYFPEPAPAPAARAPDRGVEQDPQLLAAISVAIHKYRSRR